RPRLRGRDEGDGLRGGPALRRQGADGGGRCLVRRLHDQLDRRPHRPLQGSRLPRRPVRPALDVRRDRGAVVPGVGVQSPALGQPRDVRALEPVQPREELPHANPGRPRRARLPRPDRAGPRDVHGAPAPRRAEPAPRLPGRETRGAEAAELGALVRRGAGPAPEVGGPVTAEALDLARTLGHEEVLFVQDRASGLHAVIAIHDTTLGPAVGGTRLRLYPTLDAAAVDAVRLARGMTYKAALAGVARGGGKAVIVGDPARDKTPALLAAYARVVERLGGRFYTGGDMGMDGRDVAFLQGYTKHMRHTGADPGVATADLAALGVFASIEAAAAALGRETRGLRVAVQGVGQVGLRLARQLHAAGA